MKLGEYFNLAVYEIWMNKLRTFLTLIGIIIGIGAVIVIISVVQSAEGFFFQEFNKISPMDIVEVMGRYNPQNYRLMGQLSLDDVSYLKEELNDQILQIAPRYWVNRVLRYRDSLKDATLIATTAAYTDIYNLKLASGRFLTELDQVNFNQVVVLGGEFAENLFKEEDPVGKQVFIYDSTFTVVGVLEKGEKSVLSSFSFNDDRIFIPVSVFERFDGIRNESMLLIKIRDRAQIIQTLKRIETALNERYGLADDGGSKYRVMDSASGIESIGIMKIGLTILLGGVAALTLLVAGIGVMNIMLVIIAERTREIGIRKAIGARRRDILVQFVFESIILCLFGGVLGIVFGYLGSTVAFDIASKFVDIQIVIPRWSIVLSLIFTTGVGLFFGIYPALKAAKLDPIQALYYE